MRFAVIIDIFIVKMFRRAGVGLAFASVIRFTSLRCSFFCDQNPQLIIPFKACYVALT